MLLSVPLLLILEMELSSLVRASHVDGFSKKIITTENWSTGGSYKSPRLELILSLRNATDKTESEPDKKLKSFRGRKERPEKLTEIKSKSNRMEGFDTGRINRYDEKDILVRNRTMEILKNGFRILMANGQHSSGKNNLSNHLNDALLEKILSSADSKPDLLISGVYKLPIGGNMYRSRESVKTIDDVMELKVNNTKSAGGKTVHPFEDQKTITPQDQTNDYEYDYDEVRELNRNNMVKQYPFNSDYDTVGDDNNIKNALKQIITTLRNLRNLQSDIDSCDASGRVSLKDPCSKWLECKKHLELAFVGQNTLPSCPCHYPSSIFYNDAIWDQNQKKFFRWRDASNEGERLDVYKPGAVYCIRSLLAQSSTSLSSQQCCYDGKLRLLTRGSGAGTINYVSPDVSRTLHDNVDILPWRLCKGDFTRYNLARHPDNGNRCPVNPSDEQYELQVKSSRYF